VQAVDPSAIPQGILNATGPLVLRQSHRTTVSGRILVTANDQCEAYRIAVWNGWMQFVLGELDLFSRLRAVWIDWRATSLQISTVMDQWLPLPEALTKHPPSYWEQEALGSTGRSGRSRVADLAAQIVGHLEAISRSGLVSLDFKSQDVLVRHEPNTDRWHARLSDIEAPGTGAKSTAGVVPDGLDEPCRLLMNVWMLALQMACGPKRRLSLARAILAEVGASLQRYGVDEQVWTRCRDHHGARCAWHADHRSCSRPPWNIPGNKDYVETATGSYLRVYTHYYQGTLQRLALDNGRNRRLVAIFDSIHGDWMRNQTAKCPTDDVYEQEVRPTANHLIEDVRAEYLYLVKTQWLRGQALGMDLPKFEEIKHQIGRGKGYTLKRITEEVSADGGSPRQSRGAHRPPDRAGRSRGASGARGRAGKRRVHSSGRTAGLIG
jgi:hypothetical protein